MSIKVVTVALGYFCCAQMAVAQPTQTVEGAQTFLRTVLTRGNEGASVKYDGFWNRQEHERANGDTTQSDGIENTITAVTFPNPCTAVITAREVAVYTRRDGTTPITQINVTSLPLNFGRLARTEVADRYVRLYGLGQDYRLNVGSEDMATRVAYAMEFIRQGCDETASTGF